MYKKKSWFKQKSMPSYAKSQTGAEYSAFKKRKSAALVPQHGRYYSAARTGRWTSSFVKRDYDYLLGRHTLYSYVAAPIEEQRAQIVAKAQELLFAYFRTVRGVAFAHRVIHFIAITLREQERVQPQPQHYTSTIRFYLHFSRKRSVPVSGKPSKRGSHTGAGGNDSRTALKLINDLYITYELTRGD